jgi:hypothetical protein
MAWKDTIDRCYPSALRTPELTRPVRSALRERGYRSDSTLLAAVTCRDELNARTHEAFARDWREYFSLSGLGAIPPEGSRVSPHT